MRRNSNRPSVAILIVALALAACQSTPAAPPTQTPVNPRDTFATPGAPTPFLPTMTPAPSPTVRPTATEVPPTATVVLPTPVPTKGATPTPTPVIVNGQPKMWWVDQMVKQADGGFIPPRAVTETIAADVGEFYTWLRAITASETLTVAQRIVSERQVMAARYFTGTALAGLLTSQSDQVQVLYGGETKVIDVRGFESNGLSGYYTFLVTSSTADVYNRLDWSVVARNVKVADFYESWRTVFDLSAGRWKIEKKLAGGLR
jgi:hypothetical protein